MELKERTKLKCQAKKGKIAMQNFNMKQELETKNMRNVCEMITTN